MNQFDGMSTEHLRRLQRELALSQKPMDKIQLENVSGELRRRDARGERR